MGGQTIAEGAIWSSALADQLETTGPVEPERRLISLDRERSPANQQEGVLQACPTMALAAIPRRHHDRVQLSGQTLNPHHRDRHELLPGDTGKNSRSLGARRGQQLLGLVDRALDGRGGQNIRRSLVAGRIERHDLRLRTDRHRCL